MAIVLVYDWSQYSIIFLTPYSSEVYLINFLAILDSGHRCSFNVLESDTLETADKNHQVTYLEVNLMEVYLYDLVESILFPSLQSPEWVIAPQLLTS